MNRRLALLVVLLVTLLSALTLLATAGCNDDRYPGHMQTGQS
jgi:hypothetical protein